MSHPASELGLGPSFERSVPVPLDGAATELHLRWVRPSDAALLREGFERLSDESRHLRFFGAIREMPDGLVRYFTNVDGFDHAALIAVAPADDLAHVPERGFGIARFVRNQRDPKTAELAVTVTDDAQHRGLGRQLARTLAAAALERGIEHFTVNVLWNNTRVRAFLRKVGAEFRHSDGSVAEYAVLTAALARGSF